MLALLLLLAAAASAIRIPLRRQTRDGRRLDSSSFNMHNYANVSSTQYQYYGNLTVGTPPQVLSAIFDTGSSWIVLPSWDCTGECSGDTRFKSSASSTYQSTGSQETITYGKGSVAGTVVKDTVAIGEGTSLRATNMPFVLARSMNDLQNMSGDGIVVGCR